MPIITITSDWNKNDYYLPRLKGRLLAGFVSGKKRGIVSPEEDFLVTDISNNINSFDICEACFILKHSYRSFPEGSIHLLAVNSESSGGEEMAVVEMNGHYFVSVNDGRFSLLFDTPPEQVFALDVPVKKNSFTALDLFCQAVEVILERKMETALRRTAVKNALSECPVIMEDRIIGRVMYIDSYGNAITNISKEAFSRVLVAARTLYGTEPDLTIFVRGPYLKITRISTGYHDVAGGMDVAFFNSLDLLEIAIHNGNFAAVEGIDVTAEVLIKF